MASRKNVNHSSFGCPLNGLFQCFTFFTNSPRSKLRKTAELTEDFCGASQGAKCPVVCTFEIREDEVAHNITRERIQHCCCLVFPSHLQLKIQINLKIDLCDSREVDQV